MYNVTITAGMTSSSFDVDIIDNMIQDGDKMLTITIRLIPTCLPVAINSTTTTVTITDDEGRVYDSVVASESRAGPCHITEKTIATYVCMYVYIKEVKKLTPSY